MEPRDRSALVDMIEAARVAVRLTDGVDREAFMSNTEKQLAVERLLEIVGEAARRVSDGFKAAHPDIPWRQAVGLRNLISHEYDAVDRSIVWDVVRLNLPDVIPLLERLIAPETDDG